MLFGERYFSSGDEERRFFAKGRALDFDESLFAICLEGKYVETQAVALGL